MAEQPPKPVLQKPPGYKPPTAPVKPGPKPILRKPALPPIYYPEPKRRNWCRICCCTFCILFVILILLIVALAAVLYLWLDPKLPVFHLQTFSLPRFNVTGKPDGSYLNVKTATTVEAKNPNEKLTYYYKDFVVEMSGGEDKQIDMGSTKVAGFTQANKNTTTLKIETKHVQMVQAEVGTKLMNRYKSKELRINLEVRTSVGVGVNGFKIGPVAATFIWNGVPLKRLDNDMPRGKINILKWIKIP